MISCMRPSRHFAMLLLVSAYARAVPAQAGSAQPCSAGAVAAIDPRRFEPEIRAFEAAVAIKPSPARRSCIAKARETNRRIRMEIARDSLQKYVDVFTPMLDTTGQPRPDLFVADSLHLTRAGYLLWRALLAPVVR